MAKTSFTSRIPFWNSSGPDFLGVNDKFLHFVPVLISAAKVEGFPQPTVINISGDFDDYSECAKFVGYEPLQLGSKEISQETLA